MMWAIYLFLMLILYFIILSLFYFIFPIFIHKKNHISISFLIFILFCFPNPSSLPLVFATCLSSISFCYLILSLFSHPTFETHADEGCGELKARTIRVTRRKLSKRRQIALHSDKTKSHPLKKWTLIRS